MNKTIGLLLMPLECAEAGWLPGRTLSDIRRAEWLPTWQHDNRQETVRTGSETII